MFVERLSLKNFRNIKSLNIELNNGVNIFYGDNAQGKTNIIESIYYCSMGRSHRTHIDKELINFNQKIASIQASVKKENLSDKIDIHIRDDRKKFISVNSISIKKMGELFGVLNTVIFSPEDLQLIKNGPSERRRFMDMEICQISSVYYYNLKQYYKILKNRNMLLKRANSYNEITDELSIWDMQLVDYGVKLIKTRGAFIDSINNISAEIYSEISGNKERLRVEYKPNLSCDEFESKLKKNIERDIYYGATSSGVHKDDMLFYINDNDARDYGSQGQQRTICLCAKLAEMKIIESKTLSKPVLILDDVYSELDAKRQNYLTKYISDNQTLITSTGIDEVLKKFEKDNKVFYIKEGKISSKR